MIWKAQTLILSHRELEDYKICVDMWQVRPFTFNCIFATYQVTLLELVREGDVNAKWILKADGTEVQLIEVKFLLERIFNFALTFHDWLFIPVAEMPRALSESGKALRICMRYSNGSNYKHIVSSEGNFWPGPVFFSFTGTFNDLRSSFVELVLMANARGKWYGSPSQLGKTFISLRSIPEYSHLNSSIKRLTYDRSKFLQGTISGYLDMVVVDEDFANTRTLGTICSGHPYSNVSHYTNTSALMLQIKIIRVEGLVGAMDMSECAVKVTWDGMTSVTKTTFLSEGSAHYNEDFDFPVKLVDEREVKNLMMIKRILPVDLHSRGSILFELNAAGAEYMGDAILQLRKLATAAGGGFRAFRLPVSGAPSGSSAILVVEAGFVPPLPNDFEFIHEPEVEYQPNIYRDSGKHWERDFERFQSIYRSWFPDAPTRRDFWPLDRPTGLPLSALITSLRLPSHQFHPLKLLHWVSTYPLDAGTCAESSAKDFKSPFSRVSPVAKILSRKRVGGSRDRALLVAGTLLAQRQDVYIAKGTVIEKVPKSHKSAMMGFGRLRRVPCYWVITRQGDDVCFWDPQLPRNDTNNGMVLLRGRARRHPGINENYVNNETGADENCTNNDMPVYKSPQVICTLDWPDEGAIEFNPNDRTFPDAFIPLQINPNAFASYANKYTKSASTTPNRKTLSQVIKDHAMSLPFSPYLPFADDPNVDKVPYHSVEVVFNANQVWGNLQNHNPCVIFYDFENSKHWRPFLKSPVAPMVAEIYVGPPDEMAYIERIQEEIHHHVHQLLVGILKRPAHCIHRMKVDQLADLLEDGLVHGYLHTNSYNKKGGDVEENPNISDAETDCSDSDDSQTFVKTPAITYWLEKKNEFLEYFAKVEAGRIRVALPMRLRQADVSEISRLFLRDGIIGDFIRTLPMGTNFGIAVKAYPLPASIVSTWVVLIVGMPAA